MDAAVDLVRLRSELEKRFGGAILPAGVPEIAWEGRAGFRTRVGVVDRLLPGGVPRGGLSLWVGEATGGRTAALRALVEEACLGGARAGVVDAGRTLDASFGCVGEEALEGLWVVRPPGAGREGEGPWAAEQLLRAGVFDLVVLDGCGLDAAQAHRLRAQARERDAALVVSAAEDLVGVAPGWRADQRVDFHRVRSGSGLMPGGRFRRQARLRVGVTGGEGEVELVHEPADRLRPGAPATDRRPRHR